MLFLDPKNKIDSSWLSDFIDEEIEKYNLGFTEEQISKKLFIHKFKKSFKTNSLTEHFILYLKNLIKKKQIPNLIIIGNMSSFGSTKNI